MQRATLVIAALAIAAAAPTLHAKQPVKAEAEAAAQVRCGNPVGTWRNQMGSEMRITAYDPRSGAIQGQYRTSSGAPGFYPLVGWVNSAPAQPGGSNLTTYAFTVRWNQIGSITAWTGTCVDGPTSSGLRTLWQLARPNSQFDWDHILAGADTFVSP
ncbi:avidin/streptavidin family protein [Lysobacter sp. BMK333-48F3]|uniref:avidin/streptavidin family protein n=1 Tax=Lysobacter sp. BMK333-48F3 TaxID=2867962 RepID=UPI001C8CA61E|nr:avidin/streptavidin family protein [Lysobacter sp. BMK333-48F3]MBX9403898.1 avidin/streptavidin family protein [Lysobacter sp. BMK333-48F3]